MKIYISIYLTFIKLCGTCTSVPHGPEIPVLNVPKDIDIAEDGDTELEDMDTFASYQPPIPDKNKPMPLTQAQLNDLTRDLGLSKESI